MIYGDVFMLINAACDYLALFCTALFLRRSVKKRRLFLGSAIGGVYALVYLYLARYTLLALLLSLCASALMTLAAFSFRSVKHYLRALFSFYLISFLLGGSVNALCAFLLPNSVSPLVSLLLLAVFLGLAALTAFPGARLLQARAGERRVKLSFTYDQRQYECRALIDSGNLLIDSESGLSVIVLSPALFAKTPVCARTVEASTVSESAALPCFLPEKLTVAGCERKALMAIALRAFGGEIGALVPETLLL